MSPMALDPIPSTQNNGSTLLRKQADEHPANSTKVQAGARRARQGTWQPVKMSPNVKRITNPIREVIAGIDLGAKPLKGEAKKLINLGLGDPSVFGNLPPPRSALDAIEKSLRSGQADGYPASVGYTEARTAVAEYFDESHFGGNWNVESKDVVMTHGASGALEMAMNVLADKDSNVLFPKPLFTAYETLIGMIGAEIRYYDLLPEKNWEVDLESLERQIDDKTALLMINNPSNPCGSNFSRSHLLDIAALAARHQLLVVSDEVYAGMAWSVSPSAPSDPTSDAESAPVAPVIPGKFNRGLFTPYASICGSAPCLIVGALSKRWLAPGWRTGWIIVHDPLDVLTEVREGLGRWAFRIQGPSSVIQRALPDIFHSTSEDFFASTLETLESTGRRLFDRLAQIDGLMPLLPQGAMYLMCGGLENFEFANDKEFVEALHREEKVFILPGAAFRLDGFMRFVTTVPVEVLLEACERIEAFCDRHRKRE